MILRIINLNHKRDGLMKTESSIKSVYNNQNYYDRSVKGSQSFFWSVFQVGATPIRGFSEGHGALKNLPEVKGVRSTKWFYEVVSPELRAFVKALIIAAEKDSPAKTNLLVAAAIRLFPEEHLYTEAKQAKSELTVA